MQQHKGQPAAAPQEDILAPASPGLAQCSVHTNAYQLAPIHELQTETILFDNASEIAVIQQRVAHVRASIAPHDIVSLTAQQNKLPIRDSNRAVGIIDQPGGILHADA